MNFNDFHSFIVQANYIFGALFNTFIAILLKSFTMKQHKILIYRGNRMDFLSKWHTQNVFKGCAMIIIP